VLKRKMRRREAASACKWEGASACSRLGADPPRYANGKVRWREAASAGKGEGALA